jgi:type IV secretion system protein VirB10
MGVPAYNVVSLPSSYAELPPPTTQPTPPPAIKRERPAPLTAFEALEKKALEEKLQRARSATLASVSFQNFQIPKDGVDSRETPPTGSSGALSPPQDTAPNARDNDNRQDDKNRFLSDRRGSSVALNQKLIAPRSSYQLLAGTLIPGVLLTALNSDLPGQILGQVSQNVFDSGSGNHLLLPHTQ